MIEQARFIYSPLGKAIEKQMKKNYDQGWIQVEASEVLKLDTQQLITEDAIPKDQLNKEAKNEI